jgi:hypothetical protein
VLGTKRTSEPTLNPEGCSYCTRGFTHFQEIRRIKGFFVAFMQQARHPKDLKSDFPNKFNGFQKLLHAKSHVIF